MGSGTNIGDWFTSMDMGASRVTATRAANQAEDLAKSQAAAAGALDKQLKTAPRTTTSDNFLAMKSKALSALRLGLASTSTGATGQGGSILPNGLKAKLGA